MPRADMFRQAALDRLSSPEQLDALIPVTGARGWMALGGCFVLLAAAVAWGFLGHVPTRLEASGIFLRSGGLADVVALGAGQISALNVEVGDRVERGQVIAEVAQPELAEQIKVLRGRAEQLKANLQKARAAGGRDVGLRMEASLSQRHNLEAGVAAADARARALREKLDSQTRLYDKGLLTKESVDQTREALRGAEVAMDGMRSDMRPIAADSFSLARANEATLTGGSLQVEDAERELRLLEQKLESNSRVVSTQDGRVIELRAAVGDVIVPGRPIVSLERGGERGAIEALLYVDSRQGKAVRPGMEVQIAPSTVRKERYGLLSGRVRSVESFPSTRQGLMRVLRNEQLVDAFLAETAGTPIAVRADLTVQADTPTGFRWSSGRGPDVVLSSGTRIVGYVTTRTQRPVELLLPSLDVGGR